MALARTSAPSRRRCKCTARRASRAAAIGPSSLRGGCPHTRHRAHNAPPQGSLAPLQLLLIGARARARRHIHRRTPQNTPQRGGLGNEPNTILERTFIMLTAPKLKGPTCLDRSQASGQRSTTSRSTPRSAPPPPPRTASSRRSALSGSPTSARQAAGGPNAHETHET